jgi:hypothetical protein
MRSHWVLFASTLPLFGLPLSGFAVACQRTKTDSTERDPRRDNLTPTPAASVVPARTDQEDARAIVAALEAKVQSGDLEGFYSPDGIDLVSTNGEGKVTSTPFPAAIHKHGESIGGAWVAPDGSLFAAGFMYTGVPGPDTGAVYQRDAKGTFRIGYTKTAKELANVFGRSANDVYAGGNDVLVHWDGQAWSAVPTEGIFGSILGIYAHESDLFLVTNEGKNGHIFGRRKDGAWKQETTTSSCFLRTIHGAGTAVWAGGDCGLVLRRNPDGTWKEERRQPGGTIFQLWATSEKEVHAASIDLLFSRGDGRWSRVEVPSTRIFGLAGSGHDVYALGVDGIYRGAASTFAKTTLDANACQHLAAHDGTVHCLRERRKPATNIPR